MPDLFWYIWQHLMLMVEILPFPVQAVQQRLGYFNSRPREGANLSKLDGISTSISISIPAPARGRTTLLGIPALIEYFNSRPREGANGLVFVRGQIRPNFNSRPREGANGVQQNKSCITGISIPAPARGRTAKGGVYRPGCSQFQFPPPRGGEQLGDSLGIDIISFQFPPPRGGEQQNCTK